MSKKLELEVFRYGNLVFGKVIHMDECLRSEGKLVEHSNFSVRSESQPQLTTYTLYLNGRDKAKDGNTFFWEAVNEDVAISMCANIKTCVAFINKEKVPVSTSEFLIREI